MNRILIVKLNNSSFEKWYIDNFSKIKVDVSDLHELIDARFRGGILDVPMYEHVLEYAKKIIGINMILLLCLMQFI